MKSSPKLAILLAVPARKPSPSPTRSSSDPTPQAMPNMVRKERSLCVHMARNTSPKVAKTRCIINLRTLFQQSSYLPGFTLILRLGLSHFGLLFRAGSDREIAIPTMTAKRCCWGAVGGSVGDQNRFSDISAATCIVMCRAEECTNDTGLLIRWYLD